MLHPRIGDRRAAQVQIPEALQAAEVGRAELRVELKRIQVELGASVLYVTHDQIEAMTLATRIGVLERGRLVQVGTPREIYEDPVSMYVATRLGIQVNAESLIRVVDYSRFVPIIGRELAAVVKEQLEVWRRAVRS